MITRILDVIPFQELIDEMQFLATLNGPLATVIPIEHPQFRVETNHRLPPLCAEMIRIGGCHDIGALLVGTEWLRGGPKLVRPTKEQMEAFSQIEIKLELKDYEQPFPAMMVECGPKPFIGCISYRHSSEVLVLALISEDHLNDITTFIRQREGHPIETYLTTLTDECMPLLENSLACQRIALNTLLSLMHFGHTQPAPLLPKQHAEDKGWAKENSERGHRARARVRDALMRVDFQHQVVIRRPSPRKEEYGDSGRTIAPHWVRGHWKMQPCGPGLKDRKRILIAPYLTGAEEATKPSGTVYIDRR